MSDCLAQQVMYTINKSCKQKLPKIANNSKSIKKAHFIHASISDNRDC